MLRRQRVCSTPSTWNTCDGAVARWDSTLLVIVYGLHPISAIRHTGWRHGYELVTSGHIPISMSHFKRQSRNTSSKSLPLQPQEMRHLLCFPFVALAPWLQQPQQKRLKGRFELSCLLTLSGP